MSVMARLMGIVILAVVVLVAGLGWLAHASAQQRQSDWQTQRDAHLLSNLRAAAEAQLATGLPVEVLQQAIAREHSVFPGVIAIDIFSTSGTVLLSTDVGNRGTAVPEEWHTWLGQDRSWQSEAPGLRKIGLRFNNDLGQAAGGIVVTLSTAVDGPVLARWSEWGRELLWWLAIFVLAGATASIALVFGMRRLLKPYDDAARILQGAPATPGADTLAHAAARQRSQWLQARQRSQQGMAQLQELDDES